MPKLRYTGSTSPYFAPPSTGVFEAWRPGVLMDVSDAQSVELLALGRVELDPSSSETTPASRVLGGLGVFMVPSGDTTGATDRAAVQAAVDRAAAGAGVGLTKITLASGQWYFDGAVVVSTPMVIEGMGANFHDMTAGRPPRGTQIKNVSATVTPTFHYLPTAFQIVGGALRDLAIHGNDVNDGVVGKAIAPYVITQMDFSNLIITRVRDGMNFQGQSAAEIYQNEFRNIKIVFTSRHGFFLDISAYNQIRNVECTGINGSLGYGFHLGGSCTNAQGLMTEGCVFVNAAWGRVSSVSIETISAATPVSAIAAQLNGTGLVVDGLAILNVAPGKCNYGVTGNGANQSIKNVLVGGSVGPAYVFTPYANSSGILENCKSELAHFLVEQYTSVSDLSGWRFINCDGTQGVTQGLVEEARQITRLFTAKAANFQSTADQPLAKHGNFNSYRITGVTAVARSGGATVACAGGIYTAATKGGTALVAAGQSWLGLSATGKMTDATLAVVNNTDVQTATPILSLTTGSTAAVTADVFVYGYIMDAV